MELYSMMNFYGIVLFFFKYIQSDHHLSHYQMK